MPFPLRRFAPGLAGLALVATMSCSGAPSGVAPEEDPTSILEGSARKPRPTATPRPTPTPTPRPSLTPRPTPSPTATPTPKGGANGGGGGSGMQAQGALVVGDGTVEDPRASETIRVAP